MVYASFFKSPHWKYAVVGCAVCQKYCNFNFKIIEIGYNLQYMYAQ